jgi:hypothetical protein
MLPSISDIEKLARRTLTPPNQLRHRRDSLSSDSTGLKTTSNRSLEISPDQFLTFKEKANT